MLLTLTWASIINETCSIIRLLEIREFPGEPVLVQERESAEDRCRVELSGDLVAFFVAAQPVERCRDRRREFLDELLAPLRELRNTLRLGEHDLSVATILCDVVGEGADDVPNQIVWLRRGGV